MCMVTDRIMGKKKDKKNTAAPAVSVFSILEFSPQGLTTKNVVFMNNFWQFSSVFLYNYVESCHLFP